MRIYACGLKSAGYGKGMVIRMRTTKENAKRWEQCRRKMRLAVLILSGCLGLASCGKDDVSESTEGTYETVIQASGEDSGKTQEALLPVFSKEAGFYDEEFELTLGAPAGGEIYYTTDGSDPRSSSTAVKYKKPIEIYNNTYEPNRLSAITDIALGGYNPPENSVDKGIIVRAVVKDADGAMGEVVTNSYFVGKYAPYYTEMKVISLVTEEDYLFHPDTGFYMIGKNYYEWLKSDDYEPYDSGDAQNPTNYNIHGKESEFPAAVQVFEEGVPVFSVNVGARLSGNWSRAAAQKSFRLYARKEYGAGKMKYAFIDDLYDAEGEVVEKYDKVTIRNGGNDNQTLHFRDAFFQDLTDDLAPDDMASEPCILFLNGEFWGFYLLREKPDSDYIEARYGIDGDNVAVLKNGEVESGEDEALEEFAALCRWAREADMSMEENYQQFLAAMDVQSFMDYVTVQTYINNADWIKGYVNNWIVWHSKEVDRSLPKADGKWRFVFYDMDYAAGLYHSEDTHYEYDSLNKNRASDSAFDFLSILDNLMTNPVFAKQFEANYIHIVDTCFAPDNVDLMLDMYADRYSAATIDTFRRFDLGWAAGNYVEEVEYLREFFHRRPAYAKDYLEIYCNKQRNRDMSKVEVAPVGKWSYFGEAEFTSAEAENSFAVSVPAPMPESWHIQSQAGGLRLEKGKEYRISFRASCSEPVELSLGINRNDNGDYPSCMWRTVALSGELQTYTLEFTMEHDTHGDWTLCFNYGGAAGDYVVKDVVIQEIK